MCCAARASFLLQAPSRVLLENLWAAGASVRAYDPVAMPETRRIYGDRPDLELCESAVAALDGCDALAIVTEWQEFRSPDIQYGSDFCGNQCTSMTLQLN